MSETYQPIEQGSDMVSEPTASQPYYTQSISPVDALWALYQAQTKKVRRAFRHRLLEEEDMAKKQKKLVKESLTKAFEELHAGKAKHNARNLFAE